MMMTFLKSFFVHVRNNTWLLLLALVLFSCKTSEKGAGGKAASTGNNKGLSNKDEVQFKYVFMNANKERILGNYDLAEGLFLQALKIDPNSAASMYELSGIYGFQNNKSQALLYGKKAAAIDPKNTWYQLQYANCLKDSRQLEEIPAVYELLIKNNPGNYDFYYELANTYLALNKTNEALKVYNKIEAGIGVTEEASMQKLKIYKKQNNFDKAVEEAKNLIKAYPRDAKFYGILGELYQDKGMDEKAFEAYNDLLKIDPNNAYVHLSLADYYRKQKQNDKAFLEIKQAFENPALDVDTKVKILLSYYSITETYSELKADADELCKIIVKVHPDEAKAYSVAGDFVFRDKKFDEARTLYRKAIALDKEKYALWAQLLIIESELRDYVSMQKEGKEAMELFPSQSLPYFFYGIGSIQVKNYKEGVDALTEGKEFVYNDNQLLAQFYSSIGDAQNELKNYNESDAAYDKSLELDPANVSVLNNYAYYLSLRNKNLEKAESMSKKSNDLSPNNNSYQDTYGWILYQMKKYDDAKVWIGKALENGGKTNGTLLEHYGDVLYQLGDKDAALKFWIEAKKATGGTDFLDKKIADKKLYE
jgi:tetratricopeptide (TPR) repeat protein